MGLSSLTGRERTEGRTNFWTMNKIAREKTMNQRSGTKSLFFNTLHVRNGSRGDGIGMGHRNKTTKTN
jgi:hypothetical protein